MCIRDRSKGGPTATLPVTATFAVKNTGGPAVPTVKFGASGTDTVTYTYQKTNGIITSLTTQVIVTAPSIPGPYHIKIQAENDTLSKGLQPGEGIVVHFRVEEPTPVCEPVATELALALDPGCIVYRQPSTNFAATLTANGVAVGDETIAFSVDNVSIGTAKTDADGKAVLSYDTSTLVVGDHTVYASYAGKECASKPSSNSATLGVNYAFLGYQPPVKIDGVGAGLFSGKVIPVKIKIADYYGAPVPNAEARVYFSQTTQDLVWQEAEAIQQVYADAGNLMRYDATSDQYIFNWNIGNVQNGSYNIRIGLGEAACATPHWAPVKIQKSVSKK